MSGVTVQIVRKDIKNLHLGVYPPNGRVRVAAPLSVGDDAVRLAVIRKLGWIKRRQAQFAAQPRQSEREMVSGESHYFLGQRYRLRVVEHDGPSRVVLPNRSTLELQVHSEYGPREREQVLLRWYRERLRELVPPLLAKWETTLGVQPASVRITKMKTKWGACSMDARRIWLNLELAKKPPSCLEFIMVHEMVHLLERRHNDRFKKYMDRFMPQWRLHREELNRAPLRHERWRY